MSVFRTTMIALFVLALTACGATESTDSPTATLKKFIEASKSKDVETTKKLLSKSTIDKIQKTATAQNTTVDKILLNENAAPTKETPETRSEKIEGETATVEVKNKATGEFETIPFVKEDGIWKIALDKFMQSITEKQQADNPPATSANNAQSDASAANNK